MSTIGVQDNLSEVMNVLDINGIAFEPISHDRLNKMELDKYDIVIVKEQSDVSNTSKDTTIIETRGISADEVYEKVKYMQ